VTNQAVKNLHVPRPARASLAAPGFAGVMPLRGMPGAFCTGMVKNQQGFDSELLQIGAR
jgi:hypothetical protein